MDLDDKVEARQVSEPVQAKRLYRDDEHEFAASVFAAEHELIDRILLEEKGGESAEAETQSLLFMIHFTVL